MAKKGMGFFDRKGHFFRNPKEATASDIASLLGQIGEGESLAPGIAHLLLEKRSELEVLFAEHDEMVEELGGLEALPSKVTALPKRKVAEKA